MTSVLLDTNVLIWILSAERALSRTASTRLSDPAVNVFVSFVSFWEIVLKHRNGNLWSDRAISSVFQEIRTYAGWKILPLQLEHLEKLATLPLFENHKDPFDRLLIAQALHEGMDIITADRHFARYGVRVMW